MRRTAAGIATTATALAIAASVANPGDSVITYVANDADKSRTITVGDTVAWFVDAPRDAVITLRCWTDDTKSVVIRTWRSRPLPEMRGNQATGYAVSTVLASAGYCETSTPGGGGDWFLVEDAS